MNLLLDVADKFPRGIPDRKLELHEVCMQNQSVICQHFNCCIQSHTQPVYLSKSQNKQQRVYELRKTPPAQPISFVSPDGFGITRALESHCISITNDISL